MWLETLTIIANQRRRTIVLAGLLITFAGVALLIDRPKEAVLEWLGLPLLVFGGTLLLLTVWTPSRPSRDASTSVADRLLRNLTWDGRLVPFFPAIGSAIIVADLVYNVTLSSTPALQTEIRSSCSAPSVCLDTGSCPTDSRENGTSCCCSSFASMQYSWYHSWRPGHTSPTRIVRLTCTPGLLSLPRPVRCYHFSASGIPCMQSRVRRRRDSPSRRSIFRCK